MMKFESDRLIQLVRSILETKEKDTGCAACFEVLDRFVELHLHGKDAARAMPLVQTHLDNCSDCREEFETLLAILENYPDGSIT